MVHPYHGFSPPPGNAPVQGQIPIVDSSSFTNRSVFRMVPSTPCLISVHFTDASDNHLKWRMCHVIIHQQFPNPAEDKWRLSHPLGLLDQVHQAGPTG